MDAGAEGIRSLALHKRERSLCRARQPHLRHHVSGAQSRPQPVATAPDQAERASPVGLGVLQRGCGAGATESSFPFTFGVLQKKETGNCGIVGISRVTVFRGQVGFIAKQTFKD